MATNTKITTFTTVLTVIVGLSSIYSIAANVVVMDGKEVVGGGFDGGRI